MKKPIQNEHHDQRQPGRAMKQGTVLLRRWVFPGLCLLAIFGCVNCSEHLPAPKNSGALKGNLVFWASTEEIEADTFRDLFTRFRDLNPDVHVLPTFFPSFKSMFDRLETSIVSGLGPDVLVLPGKDLSRLLDLVEFGWVKKVPPDLFDTSTFMPSALETLRHEGDLYGLPLTVNVFALLYNTDLVATSPSSLTELLAHTREGKRTIMHTGFYETCWGMTAFGGTLQAGNEQSVSEWLTWLLSAQAFPAMILHQDAETFRTYFAQGQAEYYIGSTNDLVALQQTMGKEHVGVAALPDGPHRARGFLQAQALMISPATSLKNMEIAVHLIRFLTNVEQQRRLAVHFGHVPANSLVHIDERLTPIVAALQRQARIAVPFSPRLQTMEEEGTYLYKQVLEGVLTPDEAAEHLAEKLSQGEENMR